MSKARRFAQVGGECVACGCCVKVCPRGAVWVDRGMTARVDGEKCVGCGKCAKICPAAVISLLEREADA